MRSLFAAVWVTILAAPLAALGAAGGGSSGFGGGGGGGGGGGYGGGGGGYGGGGGGGGYGGGGGGTLPGSVIFIFLAILVLVLVVAAVQAGRKRRGAESEWSGESARERDRTTAAARASRAEEIRRSALVATEDDPDFSEGVVIPRAERLFLAIQEAWDARDEGTLGTLVGPDLLVEWSRRLADFASKGWHNRIAVRSVTIEYVGIVNKPIETEDRAIVRISALVDDYVLDRSGRRVMHIGNASPETSLREYWTLGMRDGRWTLLSIEQDREGQHHLSDPIVAEPAEDLETIRDEAVVEQAVADRVPDGVDIGDLVDVDFKDDALRAARDLSLVDERFSPDVIAVAARRAVAAWAEAVDGDDANLVELADTDALRELLYDGDASGRTRIVVRGPKVAGLRVVGLDAESVVPTVTAVAEIAGARYVEDRDTLAVLAGDKTRATAFAQTFRFALADDPEHPWRLVGSPERVYS